MVITVVKCGNVVKITAFLFNCVNFSVQNILKY